MPILNIPTPQEKKNKDKEEARAHALEWAATHDVPEYTPDKKEKNAYRDPQDTSALPGTVPLWPGGPCLPLWAELESSTPTPFWGNGGTHDEELCLRQPHERFDGVAPTTTTRAAGVSWRDRLPPLPTGEFFYESVPAEEPPTYDQCRYLYALRAGYIPISKDEAIRLITVLKRAKTGKNK